MMYLTFWNSILHYWVSTRRIVYQIGDFRQFGNLAPLAGARSPNWRFLAQKSPKKKYVSKCLKLPNSSRNAIKFFWLYVTWACAAREKMCEGIVHNVYSYLFCGFWVFLIVIGVNFNFFVVLDVSRNEEKSVSVTTSLFMTLVCTEIFLMNFTHIQYEMFMK